MRIRYLVHVGSVIKRSGTALDEAHVALGEGEQLKLLAADEAWPVFGVDTYDEEGEAIIRGEIAVPDAAAQLQTARDKKKSVLSLQCQCWIESGFSSSAAGVALTYPSNPTDQTNMMQNAEAGGSFMAKDGDGNWSLVEHTALQSKAVLADFIAFRDAARTNLATKATLVDAAAEIAAVEAITWGGE